MPAGSGLELVALGNGNYTLVKLAQQGDGLTLAATNIEANSLRYDSLPEALPAARWPAAAGWGCWATRT